MQKRIPEYLQRKAACCSETVYVKQLLRKYSVATVCEEARCPNIAECFAKKTATFMLLGDMCSRNCRFCNVKSGSPKMNIEQCFAEIANVVFVASKLKLKHVVLTSVTRDDLEDGGAGVFAYAVRLIRKELPDSFIELLVPDFCGDEAALRTVLGSSPDILNHNLETVSSLYPSVRPHADYRQSLELLRKAKQISSVCATKTGIMLGLGETKAEVIELMKDAREAGVEHFTAGQYMQPARGKLPVVEYLKEEDFVEYKAYAIDLGFPQVSIAPLVRSSYQHKAN